MTNIEETLAVLLIEARAGNIAAQSQFASLTAADFTSVASTGANLISGMTQRELGALAQYLGTNTDTDTPHKDQMP